MYFLYELTLDLKKVFLNSSCLIYLHSKVLTSEITGILGLEMGLSYFFLFSEVYKGSFDFLPSTEAAILMDFADWLYTLESLRISFTFLIISRLVLVCLRVLRLSSLSSSSEITLAYIGRSFFELLISFTYLISFTKISFSGSFFI
jgi:hypothetical protein